MVAERKRGAVRSAVLMLAHFIDEAILNEYRKLKRELGPLYHVVLLFDSTVNGIPALPEDVEALFFDKTDIRNLGYPRKGRSPSTNDFEMFAIYFWRKYPHFHDYWVVEYDVRFSGSWSVLFTHFIGSRADLLGTTLHRYDVNPAWENWRTVTPPGTMPPRDKLLRGFFPLYRLSNRAMVALHEAYMQGWAGHWESVLPTVLALAGLDLEDIGGNGEFVRAGNIGRFYHNDRLSADLGPGSLVSRPIHVRAGRRPNTLWHPVRSTEAESWGIGHRARMASWLRRVVHSVKPQVWML